MLTIEQAEAIFESSDKYSGAMARFVRIDNYYGIKMYCDEFTAQNTYKIQNLFADKGLAPRAIQRVNFGDMFGYITETIVETLGDYLAGNFTLNNPDIRVDRWDIKYWAADKYNLWLSGPCDTIHKKTKKSYREFGLMVEAAAQELGYITSDLHWNNIGYDKDGNLMLIDFDNFYLESR